MGNATNFRIGILIIGSLFWDTKSHREQWRQARLRMDKAVSVAAPIRYGRKSDSRGNTYTMVFAPDCPEGQAKVVPCVNYVSSISKLVEEAKHLWRAESRDGIVSEKNELSASWCCIALLVNPGLSEGSKRLILEAWADQAAKKSTHYANLSTCVSAQGILKIDWPKLTESGDVLPLDLLIATATKPTLKNDEYPSGKSVADAWKQDQSENVNYFCSNIKNGIHTFQDEEIFAQLRS